MIRMLIWLLVIYIGYRIISQLFNKKKPDAVKQSNTPDAATTYKDPVCGMYVSEDDAVIGKLDGQRHHFCSMACLDKYREQLDQSKS